MNKFTILSSTLNLISLHENIKSVFEKTNIDTTNNSRIIVDNEKIVFNILTSDSSTFSGIKKNLINYFSPIKVSDKIKTNLILKLNSINSVIGIILNTNIDKNLYNKLLNITKLCDGLVFVDNSMLLDYNGCLVLDINGSSEITEYKYSSYDNKIQKINDSTNIKSSTSKDSVIIKSKDEICKRYIATSIISSFADGLYSKIELDKISEVIKVFISDFDANDFFTESEKICLNNPSSLAEEILKNLMLNFESSYMLLWIIGNTPKLSNPDSFYNKDFLVTQFFNYRNFKNLYEKSKIIKKETILSTLKTYYKYLDSFKENPDNNKLNFDIVSKRYKTLLWLTNYKNLKWDDIHNK